MRKYITGSATASGDTVKTSLGTLKVPDGYKRIVGAGVSIGGAGMTTLENISGILDLDSQDLPDVNQTIPFSCGGLVTSGGLPTPVKTMPMDIPCGNGGQTINAWVTMDMALTVNNTVRPYIVVEN